MTDLMVPSKRPRASSFSEKHPDQYAEGHAAAAAVPDSLAPEKEIGQAHEENFLEKCRFCKKKLRHDEDIYMYGYLGAFCSISCRDKQITCDIFRDLSREKSLAKPKKGRMSVTRPKPPKDEGLETSSSRFFI